MTRFRRYLVAVTAALVAVRVLFPVQYFAQSGFRYRVVYWPWFPLRGESGQFATTDFNTTILHAAGIVVAGAAVYVLWPQPSWNALRSSWPRLSIGFTWVAYIVALALGVQRYGLASSPRDVTWFPTSVGLAAFVSLVWLTWSSLHRRGTASSEVRRRYGVITIVLISLLLSGGYFGQRLQENRQAAALQARAVEFAKELENRYRIVEGRRIGPVHLGMSLADVNKQVGRRYSSGQLLPHGLSSYTWNPPSGSYAFWTAYVDSSSGKAVVVAYGFGVPRNVIVEPGGRNVALDEIREARFQTTKGAKFGDSPSTVKALYGQPIKVTRLKGHAATVRFHYPSIRTEFQFSERDGLLSVLIYVPGYPPDVVIRGR